MRPLLCYLVIPVLMLAACQSAPESSQSSAAYEAAADSTQFSNDITPLNSPSRKRVRTADVRCRVNNVFHAAQTLEHAVNAMNGIVVESTMQNTFGPLQDVPYRADSLKRIQLYTPTAQLTLRVPAAGLDSIVHTLTSMAAFIDYRTLKEQDKTMDYLSNAYKNKDTGRGIITPAKQGTSLDVAVYQDAKRDQAINRKIANLVILDDVNYATFSVQLFQPQLADIQVVVNPDRITRAGFGTEVLSAIGSGAEIIRAVFLFLLQLWPLLLLAGAAVLLYKKLPAFKSAQR